MFLPEQNLVLGVDKILFWITNMTKSQGKYCLIHQEIVKRPKHEIIELKSYV